jgi:hypothetical protein
MKMKDETSRQIMIEIAEGYERLAKHAEERAKKRANREHLAQTERRRCSTVVGVGV